MGHDQRLTSGEATVTAPCDPLDAEAARVWMLEVLDSPDRTLVGSARHIDETLVLGRSSRVSVPIDDKRLSRRHACLRPLSSVDGLELADLDSKNGTRAAGLAVRCQPLRDGDIVRIGDTLLRITHRLRLVRSSALNRKVTLPPDDACSLVAESPALQRALSTIAAFDPDSGALLVSGPVGSGRRTLARHAHHVHARPGPCVVVDTSHSPPRITIAAASPRPEPDPACWCQLATRGTLVLCGVATLEPGVRQTLQRACAASHGPMLVITGGSDLAWEGPIGARVELAPLHERPEDVLALARRTLGPEARPSAGFLEGLLLYTWPGEGQELEALLAPLAGPRTLRRIDLPEPLKEALAPPSSGSRAERVEALAAALDPERRALLVDLETARLRPPGDAWRDLSRHTQVMAIIAVLVAQRWRSPGEPLSVVDLFEQAWPDEQGFPSSAQNRVYKTLSNARRHGGLEGLLRSEDGYLLDPDVALWVAP